MIHPLTALFDDIVITDRYDMLGVPYPDDDCCPGQCEGIGCVPVFMNINGAVEEGGLMSADAVNDAEGNWRDWWMAAEAVEPATDGWHFVTCPQCGGTGKKSVIIAPPGTKLIVGNHLKSAWRRWADTISNYDYAGLSMVVTIDADDQGNYVKVSLGDAPMIEVCRGRLPYPGKV